MKDLFLKVSNLFQSPKEMVRVANAMDKAYADGVGKPEWHTPFTIENAETVACNLAGLYSADTSANMLMALRKLECNEENYVLMLKDIIADNISETETYIIANVANVAWRTCQPFRGITNNPLDRITRDVNKQFNLLPQEEQDKDIVQVATGAGLLLNWLC